MSSLYKVEKKGNYSQNKETHINDACVSIIFNHRFFVFLLQPSVFVNAFHFASGAISNFGLDKN